MPKPTVVRPIPYLELKRENGLNIIKLAKTLQEKPQRIYTLSGEGYSHFKLNSVFYPVINQENGLFLEADEFYQINSDEIKLMFPKIGSFNGSPQDTIYWDNMPGVLKTSGSFALYVTLTDTPDKPSDYYKQYIELVTGTREDNQGEAGFLFHNGKDFTLNFGSNAPNNETLEIFPDTLFYNKGSKFFEVIETMNQSVFKDTTQGMGKHLVITKETGGFSSPVSFLSGTMMTRVFQMNSGRIKGIARAALRIME